MVPRLNAMFADALETPRMREFVAKASGDVFGLKPADFERFQRADIERWRRVTQAAKIQPE